MPPWWGSYLVTSLLSWLLTGTRTIRLGQEKQKVVIIFILNNLIWSSVGSLFALMTILIMIKKEQTL